MGVMVKINWGRYSARRIFLTIKSRVGKHDYSANLKLDMMLEEFDHE
jgi:hypothetical protein